MKHKHVLHLKVLPQNDGKMRIWKCLCLNKCAGVLYALYFVWWSWNYFGYWNKNCTQKPHTHLLAHNISIALNATTSIDYHDQWNWYHLWTIETVWASNSGASNPHKKRNERSSKRIDYIKLYKHQKWGYIFTFGITSQNQFHSVLPQFDRNQFRFLYISILTFTISRCFFSSSCSFHSIWCNPPYNFENHPMIETIQILVQCFFCSSGFAWKWYLCSLPMGFRFV